MGAASVHVDKVVNVITHSVEGLLRFAEPQYAIRVARFCVDGNPEATSLLPHRAFIDG